MTDPRTPAVDLDELGRRVARIDLDSLTDDQIINLALRASIERAADRISEERVGRRLSQRGIIVALLAVVLVLGFFVRSDRADDARYSRVTCDQRIERSGQIHDAIVAGVDAIAVYVDASALERREVLAAVEKAVRAELPPPDC